MRSDIRSNREIDRLLAHNIPRRADRHGRDIVTKAVTNIAYGRAIVLPLPRARGDSLTTNLREKGVSTPTTVAHNGYGGTRKLRARSIRPTLILLARGSSVDADSDWKSVL